MNDLPVFAGVLWTGSHLLDLLAPDPGKIEPSDIARGLSRLHRFAGHTSRPWTVLQHSILCEELAARGRATAAERLAVLLHDAPEYILGDIPTPLKVLLPDYRVIEDRLCGAVWSRFGLWQFWDEADLPFWDMGVAALIATVDREALEIERALFLPADLHGGLTFPDPARAPDEGARLKVARLEAMSVVELKRLFLGRICTLTRAARAGISDLTVAEEETREADSLAQAVGALH